MQNLKTNGEKGCCHAIVVTHHSHIIEYLSLTCERRIENWEAPSMKKD